MNINPKFSLKVTAAEIAATVGKDYNEFHAVYEFLLSEFTDEILEEETTGSVTHLHTVN